MMEGLKLPPGDPRQLRARWTFLSNCSNTVFRTCAATFCTKLFVYLGWPRRLVPHGFLWLPTCPCHRFVQVVRIVPTPRACRLSPTRLSSFSLVSFGPLLARNPGR